MCSLAKSGAKSAASARSGALNFLSPAGEIDVCTADAHTGSKSFRPRPMGCAYAIEDNPKSRVRQGNQWRSGVAAFRPDDDVVARGRKFGRLGAKVVKALETTPVSVRIDFTD